MWQCISLIIHYPSNNKSYWENHLWSMETNELRKGLAKEGMALTTKPDELYFIFIYGFPGSLLSLRIFWWEGEGELSPHRCVGGRGKAFLFYFLLFVGSRTGQLSTHLLVKSRIYSLQDIQTETFPPISVSKVEGENPPLHTLCRE